MTDSLDRALLKMRHSVERRVHAKLRERAFSPSRHQTILVSKTEVEKSDRPLLNGSVPEKSAGGLWDRLTQFARDRFLA